MKIILVAGARPNFMKIAPLMAAFAARRASRPDLETLLVHTGQHYDAAMSDSFFEDLQIPRPTSIWGWGPAATRSRRRRSWSRLRRSAWSTSRIG